jgi:predicted esterase YcpF (UPF0227 family)
VTPIAEAPTHLLYLHGFRSSPKSFKAQRLHAWLRRHRPDVNWWCPQLPPSPAQAAALVERGIAGWPHASMAVVGSSLGGFYATWVAERTGCPAVLLNPAVHPARDLAQHIGEHTGFHDPDEHFFFRVEYIDELLRLEVPVTHPQRYLLVAAKGDEVLDWREMVERYRGANLALIEGGDHALSDFDGPLADLVRFLHLQPPA